ncbi:MAG: aldo/keto reductase [Planctomycetota bacterium]|nr:MAG: aldo/keto reductase [Planctomycetota bacterium]
MQTRALGRTDLAIPAVSFGAYALGGGYWGAQDEAQGVRAIEVALELGMCAIDTAPVYGLGASERLVGRALAGRRARAIVMTKVGLRWDGPNEPGDPRVAQAKPQVAADGSKVPIVRDSRPAIVRACVDASLSRLGLERIDLVQIHWPDPHTPLAETLGELLELRRAGKVAWIGVSNFSAAQIEEAARILAPIPLASHQLPFGLLTLGAARELLPQARRAEIGALAYGALGQGLLTGAVRAERAFAASEGRARRATFQPRNRARVNRALDEVVAPIARAHGASIAAVVLAWTAGESGVTSVLAGARNPEQVRENARAAGLVLTPDERARIRAAFEQLRLEPGAGAGWRAWLRHWLRR